MDKKKLFPLFTAAALALTLAACGTASSHTTADDASAGGAASSDWSKITLRVAAASAENAQGLIEAAGLDDTPYTVDFTVMQGGNLVMEAIAADQIDLGTGSQIPPLSASLAANGGNFKIIAVRQTHTLEQELIIPAGSDITSVAQLKGKKVGYVQNTTAHYFLEKMLEEAGLEWTDIESVPLTTSDGLSAILSGEIDALASYGNSVSTAKAKGAATLESAEDILTGDFYWYATPSVIEDPTYHAVIADYLERYNEAAEWARQNPEDYAAYLSELTGQDYDYVYDLFLRGSAQKKTAVRPISSETIASEQDIADTFYKIGVFDQEIDAEPLFDRSFDEEVAAFPQY